MKIYSTVRPYLRNIAVIDRKFTPPPIVSTAFAVLHPHEFLESRYLLHWLRSQPFQEDVAAKMKGVAYPAISDSDFWQCQIAVPPPEEQRRIVAKVEELLALCDELEARQVATREHRTRLVHSALDHLTAAKDEQDFQKQCSFILHNSALIFDSVPALRQTILALAVAGRLVPQDPAEGDGSVFVQRILKDRGLGPATANADANAPVLPARWGATSVADVFEVVGGIQKTLLRTPRNNTYHPGGAAPGLERRGAREPPGWPRGPLAPAQRAQVVYSSQLPPAGPRAEPARLAARAAERQRDADRAIRDHPQWQSNRPHTPRHCRLHRGRHGLGLAPLQPGRDRV